MLDLTVPMVEVWFSGAKLSEHASDVEALKAASFHADSLPLIAESVEYELRRDTMKYIVHRRIVGPDAPALGPVLTISSTALTVTLDRPASGPTSIDRYELERYSGSAWVQIASGLSIFGATNQYADSSLTASTAYQYRCRAVDTTERESEYSYASGTTSAGVTNTAPAWAAGTMSKTVKAGSSTTINPADCSDAEGDQITFTLIDTSPNDPTISVSASGIIQTTVATGTGVNSIVVRASDGLLTANKTILLTVTAAASGTNFDIAPGVSTFNAAAAGVQPGDTITILGVTNGSRGPLVIADVNGTASARITIRSETTRRTIIRRATGSSSGFVLQLTRCIYFDLTGAYTTGADPEVADTCGIKVMYATSTTTNKDNPSAWVQVSGYSHHYTIQYLEVAGGYASQSTATGIGIQVNDQSLNRGGGVYRDGIEIAYCRINNTARTGLYIGPNFTTSDMPLKNVELHHNYITNVGNTGITLKGCWAGTNSIHDNYIHTTGRQVDGTAIQRNGISIQGAPVSVYNNKIFNAGYQNSTAVGEQEGIKIYTFNGPSVNTSFNGYGPFSAFVAEIYNNLIVDATSDGIVINHQAGMVPNTPNIYNNTIVSSGDVGIRIRDSSGGFVRNNISVSNTTSAISGAITVSPNVTSGSPSTLFVAPESENYHLAAATTSATGTAGVNYSTTDIEGTPRSTPDCGAYEYI